MTVSTLNPSDIDRVDELMKRNGRTLGFLPRQALLDYLTSGTVLGAKSDDGSLIGYLLYASYEERFRIAHLCVSEQHRGRGLARQLFEALKERCTTQCVIRLNCRRDYTAHHLWPKLGLIPVNEKPGRSLDGHPLTCWEFRVKGDRQLDLFKESASDQALDVVIDSHILFHFGEPQSSESNPSRALLADFLADLIRIWLTDEIFLEVDRQSDPRIRHASRALAHLYPEADYDRELAQLHESELVNLLRPRKASDQSDIRHLAKTAASDIGIFVTRDRGILRYSAAIASLTDLEVISPVDLVRRLHEVVEKGSYSSMPISGQELVWRRAREDDTPRLLEVLHQPGESKRKLQEEIDGHLCHPESRVFEVLFRRDENSWCEGVC